MTKLLFLSGPMRGFPELNRPAFHVAAKLLRDHGYHVVSPAELCEQSRQPGHKHCARKDLQALLTFPFDGLATLPDGPTLHPLRPPSQGMRIERTLAVECLRIVVAPVEQWLACDPAVGVVLDNATTG